jgi:hypothetical protein
MVVNFPDGTQDTSVATTSPSGTLSFAYPLPSITGDYSIQAETSDGAVSLATALFSSGTYVVTDKPDYKPGETVTFSGRGFQPGENVGLVVRQNYPGGAPDRAFSALADASGAFVSSEFVVGEQDRNTTMVVTAGGRAETMFSDASAAWVSKEVGSTTITVAPSISATFAPAPTAGNFLVAIVGAYGPTTAIGAPAGWSTAINEPATATTPAQAIFYKFNSAGAADASVTATFTPSSTGTITLQQFSNVLASSDPYDGSNSNTGGSTAAASTGTLTTTSGSLTDLLIGGVSAESATQTLNMQSGTVGGGFLVESPTGVINGGGAGSQRIALQSADRKTSPAGSSTGFTISGTNVPSSIVGWRGQVAAFKTKADTTTAVVSSSNPSIVGQPVAYTATVSPNTVTGNVDFTQTGPTASPCTAVPLALVAGQMQAQCTVTYATAVTPALTASYNGTTTFATSSASVAQVVNKAPTTTVLTVNTNPSVVGQTLTFTATITANSPSTATVGTGGSVQFKDLTLNARA